MLRPLAVLLVVSAAGFAAPVPKAFKAKALDLTGTWEIAELMVGLQDAISGNPKVWVIDGNRVTAYHRNPDGTLRPWEPGVAITLVRPDGGDGQDEIDYVRTGDDRSPLLKGRLKIDKDEFTLCFTNSGKDRPAAVGVSQTTTVERYKRVKDK